MFNSVVLIHHARQQANNGFGKSFRGKKTPAGFAGTNMLFSASLAATLASLTSNVFAKLNVA